MIRIFRLLTWFFLGVVLVTVPILSFAAVSPVSVPGVSANAAGQLIYTSRAGIPSVVYPALSTSSPLSVPLPPVAGVPPGRQLMVIPTTISPNAVRVGTALVSLARLAGPVGLGLNLVTLVCSTTQICTSATDPNELVISNTINPYIYGVSGFTRFSSVELCEEYRRLYAPADPPSIWTPNAADTACMRNGVNWQSYSKSVNPNSSVTVGPPTESQWSAAAVSLAAATGQLAQIVQSLQAQGQPVPVDKPVLSPASATSSPTTTVNRDQAGNIINTTTTSTTTNISPVTNTSTTNTVNVTQVTNTTITDSTGAVSSSTQTDLIPPEPDDPDIQFDQVDDVNLETQELPLSMPAASSWGEGSCPPDPSVSVLGHPIAVPVHVVCDYMTGVRGAVIALFALISAYIVIGVKFEG